MLILGLGGLLAAIATLYASPIEGVTDLGCGVRVLDCSKALGSAYGKVAGIPLGVLGGTYFVFWSLLVAAGRRSKTLGQRWAVTWTFSTGVAMSLTLLAILGFVIKAPCFWCLVTHACNLGAAALWWPSRVWRMDRGELKAMVRIAAISAVVACLAGWGFFQLYELRVARAEAAAKVKTIW